MENTILKKETPEFGALNVGDVFTFNLHGLPKIREGVKISNEEIVMTGDDFHGTKSFVKMGYSSIAFDRLEKYPSAYITSGHSLYNIMKVGHINILSRREEFEVDDMVEVIETSDATLNKRNKKDGNPIGTKGRIVKKTVLQDWEREFFLGNSGDYKYAIEWENGRRSYAFTNAGDLKRVAVSQKILAVGSFKLNLPEPPNKDTLPEQLLVKKTKPMVTEKLKKVTNLIKSIQAPTSDYLRLGWVEIQDNEFVVTEDGEDAQSDINFGLVSYKNLAEYAAAEVKRREKEETKEKKSK